MEELPRGFGFECICRMSRVRESAAVADRKVRFAEVWRGFDLGKVSAGRRASVPVVRSERDSGKNLPGKTQDRYPRAGFPCFGRLEECSAEMREEKPEE